MGPRCGVAYMRQYEVTLRNRPGELARLTDALARREINIRALSTERTAGKSTKVFMVTDDGRRTLAALRGEFEFISTEVLTVTMPDRPGALASVASKLAAAGINIDIVYTVDKDGHKVEVVLVTDNPVRAKRVLG